MFMTPTIISPENFDGYFIYDCAIRNNAYCFLLFENTNDGDTTEPKKRLVSYFPDFNGKPLINGHNYVGFEIPHLAVATTPKEQAIMLGLNGAVAVLGSGESGLQDRIPGGAHDQPIFGGVSGATSINGYVYVVGGWRHVAKRVDANQWVAIHDRKSMPIPKSKHGLPDGGFDAIAGFNEDDIYCVGDDGDAWRFDGKKWRQCPLPTNMFLHSVCCAEDGFVYIGAQSGSIIKGRGDKWKVIHKGDLTLPFKDMVWFDGKVWCTSDYGLWTIENDKLIESELPSSVTACSGNLAAGFGKLLLAGMHGATVYDGKTWERLV
jgi:hypothetical protein